MDKYFQILEGVITPEEGNNLLDYFEANGVDAWAGADKHRFKQHRLIIRDKGLAMNLFKRVEVALPKTYKNLQIIGICDRFKVYSYRKNQSSSFEKNGYCLDQGGNKTVLNLHIYLNDNFTGGSTILLHDNWEQKQIVTPKIGSGILYDCEHYYVETPVTSRTKYVIIADIMGSKMAPPLRSQSMVTMPNNYVVGVPISPLSTSSPQLGSVSSSCVYVPVPQYTPSQPHNYQQQQHQPYIQQQHVPQPAQYTQQMQRHPGYVEQVDGQSYTEQIDDNSPYKDEKPYTVNYVESDDYDDSDNDSILDDSIVDDNVDKINQEVRKIPHRRIPSDSHTR